MPPRPLTHAEDGWYTACCAGLPTLRVLTRPRDFGTLCNSAEMDPFVPLRTMGRYRWPAPEESGRGPFFLTGATHGMPGTAAIFVDGAYLDKVLFNEHWGKRIDYSGLVNELAQGHEILRTYYYHCMPYRGRPPTQDDEARYQSRQRFITALKNLPRFEVRLGRLVIRGTDAAGNRIFQQKRVDTIDRCRHGARRRQGQDHSRRGGERRQ